MARYIESNHNVSQQLPLARVQTNAKTPAFLQQVWATGVVQVGFVPSGWSKSKSSMEQDFSSGLSRSHTSPSTLAMITRSAKLLDRSFAISIGLVSQLVPLRIEPSGIVMSISFLGWATDRPQAWWSCFDTQIQPLTHSSYSAFNLSKMLIRWSKYSGLGCN